GHVVGFEDAHSSHVGTGGQRHRYGFPCRSVEVQSNRARHGCTDRPNVVCRIASDSAEKVVGPVIGCRLLAEGYGRGRVDAYFLSTHRQVKGFGSPALTSPSGTTYKAVFPS